MILTFNVPIYRFLNKESHVDSMIDEGKVFFNTIKAFNKMEDPQFKDDDEGGHMFKIPVPMTPFGINNGPMPKVITSSTLKKRRIPDAWALCGTCSPISRAKKQFAVRIEHPMQFLQQIDFAIERKFGQKLPIFFGPVSYYDEQIHNMTMQEQPIYFSKTSSYKDDFEFRIVVIPPPAMQDALLPIVFEVPDPKAIFTKPLIL